MNVVTKAPLRITDDTGADLVTEPAPGQFDFSIPRGLRPWEIGALHRLVEDIVDERLSGEIPDPERALAHWGRIFFSGNRRQS